VARNGCRATAAGCKNASSVNPLTLC
jgi:hypothetical protein